MKKLFKNWRFLLWLAFIFLSLVSIMFIGIQFGVDFKGGTLFQIHLEEKPTSAQLSTITAIIARRIDAFGLKDSKVSSIGEQFILAQIAETNPAEIEHLELLLKTQGRFEATLDGNILFNGSEIIQIIRNPTQYGVFEGGQNGFEWRLPFTLNEKAAERFSQLAFHRCDIVSVGPSGQNQYDCAQTFFFIDRPQNAVLVIPQEVFDNDKLLFSTGTNSDFASGFTIEKLLENASIPYIVVSNEISGEQVEQLNSFSKTTALVHPSAGQATMESLEQAGFFVREIDDKTGVPWTWRATGARTTISLTPGVTGLEPFIEEQKNAKILYDLSITGSGTSAQDALSRLEEVTILLETGSLPVPIDEISKETISPYLGKEFFDGVILIGLAALASVSTILFIRYRRIKIALPIAFTALSEIIIILGFASFFRFNLDLAAVTGILAVIGTGVDHQIIIADELLKSDDRTSTGLDFRSKRAFFMIMAIAATITATMLPLVFFDFGLGKLVGFALTTILGVIIGTAITRPAFTEIAKYILETEQRK